MEPALTRRERGLSGSSFVAHTAALASFDSNPWKPDRLYAFQPLSLLDFRACIMEQKGLQVCYPLPTVPDRAHSLTAESRHSMGSLTSNKRLKTYPTSKLPYFLVWRDSLLLTISTATSILTYHIGILISLMIPNKSWS
jgi:hypothetical protein